MITVMRKQFKGSIKFVLWIIVAAFVVGIATPLLFRQAGGLSGIWAIKVNGQDIAYPDYAREVEKQRQRILAFRQQYGEYADWLLSTMGILDPKENAYKALVRQELLNQYADTLGIFLNYEYVTAKLADPLFVSQELGHLLPPQLIDESTGVLNEGMFKRYLQRIGMNAEMFERTLERDLVEKIANGIIATSFYLPTFDVKQKYREENAKKSFTVLTLDKSIYKEEERKKPLSQEEIKKYFDEQNSRYKRYWVAEKRSGNFWTFDPKSYGISVTNQEIKQYYDSNKVKLFVEMPTKVEVRRILFKVSDEQKRAKVQVRAARTKDDIMQDPSKFAQFAKERSEDAKSASKGGLLEPFNKSVYEHNFERAAFTLPQDGAVSDVIETQEGFEILQRVGKTAQTYKSLEKASAEIKDTLAQKKFKRQFTQDLRVVIEKIEAGDTQALSNFVEAHGGKAQKVEGKTRDETPVVQRLFKLSPGQSDFFVEDDEGVAVMLTDIQERYLPSLESIEKTVKNDYIDEKASEVLKSKTEEIKNMLADTPLDQIKKSFKISSLKTDLISKKDTEAVEKLTKDGVPMARLLQIEKIGALVDVIQPESAYIGRLDDVSYPSQQDFEEHRAEIQQEIADQRKQQFTEGFVASLHRNARIESNPTIITLQD